MSQPHCYAIRLVNPYAGVLQVVSDGTARSLCRDGYNWEIQVQIERGRGGWGRRRAVASRKSPIVRQRIHDLVVFAPVDGRTPKAGFL